MRVEGEQEPLQVNGMPALDALPVSPTQRVRRPPPAHPIDALTPQVEQLMTTVTSGRYVAFSVAAMASALASALMDVRLDEEETAEGSLLERVATELLKSRLSSMIVFHFYVVVLYHVFLAVTRLSFGEIRRPEIQQTKETILHFILMRSLLLASTLGGSGSSEGDGEDAEKEPSRTPIELLLVWLSVIGFLRGLLSICNARFDYLLTRPMARTSEFHRLALTLLAVLVVNVVVAVFCSFVPAFSASVVHLTWFEAALLLVKALQLGTKVVFHVFDVGNLDAEQGLEKGEYYLLLLQTGLSGAYLVLLVTYYLYIISMDHFRVSFLDFILILNVKNATVALLEKVKQVQTYQQVVVELDALFPDASADELEAVKDDVCVICLKSMDTHAKKLDCGHLFHRLCLRQCLQRASVGDAFAGMDPMLMPTRQQAVREHRSVRTVLTSFRCPLCRKPVRADKPEVSTPAPTQVRETPVVATEQPPEVEGDHARDVDAPRPPVQAPVEPPAPVFRLSTEALSRWLPVPNLSFEVVRPPVFAPFVVTDEMLHRVWQVFPQYSMETIRRDLMVTRSPERTIERILAGFVQSEDGENREDDELNWNATAL
ncbi:hypothetical protein Poli38472_011468 [Pythium oligandrum]|uniref:RING-type domain-containing protein n=1 Tax=Pythium oligandrum TaxID=41045 RepID=A0A8K1FNF1_PYTOL|nr:hypothetical protein Poli38472_011468 [Pythium oligandrum]|eukprot:TMW64588.1 hypothetical protein Poli38472_011468 [Pythium oligandrum]